MPNEHSPSSTCITGKGLPIDVAVVIAAFKPGRLLDHCLTALLQQESVAAFEIIVVDSSADGTAERIEHDFPTVTVVPLEQQTHQSIARTIGIQHTQAAYIAITDQDCVVPADWLKRLLAHHQAGDYAAVGGAIVNGTPRSIFGTTTYLIEFNEFLPLGQPRLVGMIPHCNICFRREVFDAVGPFRPLPPGAEDLVFNFLLAQQKQLMLFDPHITVTHQNRTGLRAFLHHQRRLGFGSAVARRTVPLSGQIFNDYPWLACSLPFIRSLRTAHRLLFSHLQSFVLYILLLPILIPGYTVWTIGFFAGLRHPLPDDDDGVRQSRSD